MSATPGYGDAEILSALAAGLDDGQLKLLFPKTEPGKIRDRIRLAAQRLTPATSQMKLPAATAPLAAPPKKMGSGSFLLFTDGACRGNPGQSGAGVTILDSEGGEIFANGAYLGTGTNNVAEYKALILGLKMAVKLSIRSLEVRMDSELIVRQLQGRYQVKNVNLKPLYDEAVKLIKTFASCKVSHVERSQNARADELANRAIDERLPGW